MYLNRAAVTPFVSFIGARRPEVWAELCGVSRRCGLVTETVDSDQHANGKFVVFLSDAVPTVGSLRRLIAFFGNRPKLGGASFGTVVVYRRAALMDVGGVSTDFKTDAARHRDLSFRLAERRWEIDRLHDLHARTVTPAAGDDRQHVARDAVMLAIRHFPRRWVTPFVTDALRRNRNLPGTIRGITRSILPGHRRPVGLAAFETVVGLVRMRRNLTALVRSHGVRSILLVGLGEQSLPFMLAAEAIGLAVTIADERFAGGTFRGAAVVRSAVGVECDLTVTCEGAGCVEVAGQRPLQLAA